MPVMQQTEEIPMPQVSAAPTKSVVGVDVVADEVQNSAEVEVAAPLNEEIVGQNLKTSTQRIQKDKVHFTVEQQKQS